jgi:hypothetical protein
MIGMMLGVLELRGYTPLPDPADSIARASIGRNASVSKPATASTTLQRTFEGLEVTDAESVALPDPILIPHVLFADSTLEKRNHAHSLLEQVQNGQRFLESLDALTEIELPIGVIKTGGAIDYSILIDRINFNTSGAIMDVYVSLALPQTGDRIAFNGKIPLSKEGGITGTARVHLLGDHFINLGKSLLTIKGTNSTYVEFDCNGFKGVSLQAELQFSRDLIIPEDQQGKPKPEPERVRTQFSIYAQSLNDLMVGITLPPFQVKGLKGVGFNVQQAFMDWSDLLNPPALQFPAGYPSTFTEHPLLWQGFYLQRLDVKLPASFKSKKSAERITLGVENMILDDMGFTGSVFADHILTAGDMSGWAYTIDHIGLELVTNTVKGFEVSGRISVPKIKKTEGNGAANFGYSAQRSADGNYIFAVSIENNLRLPMFGADLNLYPGSSITVKEKDNTFYPTAVLNGDISIKGSAKGIKPDLKDIRFEGMQISSEQPHFDIQKLSFGSDGSSSSASGFPLLIKNIQLQKSGSDKIGIGFDLTINISGKSEDEGFGGTAALVVWGKRELKQMRNVNGVVIDTEEDWKFDNVELSGVGINIKKPGVIELEGMIRFFDEDAVYGEGFSGKISGKFGKLGVSMEAAALFGKTPSFRYWFADAMVSLEKGVPITPGLSAFGFGGGFYSKMKQATQPVSSPLGKNRSGIAYVPDENTIGIKAIVMLGTPRPEAFKGDVSLEIILNRHGGINSVTFTGNGQLMSGPIGAIEEKLKEMAPAAISGKANEKLMAFAKGQIYASMMLKFDNVNDVFHGDLEFYVNVAGGLVRGIGPGNKAGWATIHFSREEWYILVGTPDQPVGLEVARLFKSRSYFMLGKNLPGSPPPPQQVSEILGNIDLDYMRDMNQLESGMGFAFGLHFGVDTGDLSFLIFYGRFSAGTGVDFMLKDYGENCTCAGQSGPVGINGWFANGQAYAFVQGAIGIRVKLKFIKGDFEILSIGAAAVLQAKGPNPFWMKGIVGGYYSILGGLVKGKCNFEVELGRECKIIPAKSKQEINPLEDVRIISDLSPVSGEKDVDVFAAPQAAFSMPVGEIFDVTDESDTKKLFRARVESFDVTDGTTKITGSLRWNETKDVVAFDAYEVLPPKKELKVFVKILFEELRGGQWRTLQFEGKPLEETRETVFQTGDAPDYIPPSNVEISYPLVGQFNFYPKEHNQGFIELKKSQSYLFNPGEEWIQKIHVNDVVGGAFLTSDISYNASEKRVYFTIPDGLQNAKAYRLEILNLPKQSTIIDANVKNVSTNVGEVAGEMTVNTKKIEGNLELKEIKTLYAALFRTSSFNNFKDKVSTITLSSTFRETVGGGNVFQLFAYLNGKELFDKAEISGTFNDRTVKFEALLNPNDWYQKNVYPLVYDGYPLLSNMTLRYRNVQEFGLPPVKSLYIEQPRYVPELTEENMSTAFTPVSIFNRVVYDVMSPMYLDYQDIQNLVANYVADNPEKNMTARFASLLTTPFPGYRYGKYKFRLSYVIPRTNKTTSSHEWELFNTLKD